jgi:hypothetical protein
MNLCGGIALAALGVLLAAPAVAQAPAPDAQPKAVAPAPALFVIHGVIRSGGTALPGVTVTATHSLTGRKVITSTDVDGSFRLGVPSKGRWVLRAEFSAFAPQTAELMMTPAQPDAAHDFELVLLSRAPKPANEDGEPLEQASGARAPHTQAAGGRSAQRLSLSADDAALAQAAGGSDLDAPSNGVSGLAASADATNPSVSVSGRMGNAQDFGLTNMDDLRERIDALRARGQLPGGFDAPGAPGGGGAFTMGGGPPPGAGGGGRMRMGSLTKPHGQIYYNASNAVLDAAPYAISGQPVAKPSYGSNKFGGMIGGPLKIPHVYDDGGKTFVFLNYSGIRSTTPYDVFSHVPTEDERNGIFRNVSLFDPATGQPLGTTTTLPDGETQTTLPSSRFNSQAEYLFGNNPQHRSYIPLPNVTNGALQNYHFSSAAESDQDIFSLRLTHNFAAGGGPFAPGMGGGGRSGRPRNNLNFGINYQRNESDNLEPYPTVGGHTHTNGYNAFAGWALGKGKLSNQLRFTWNRSRSHVDNYYANLIDVAGSGGAGISGISEDPANWGAPNLSFSHYSGLADVAPSQRDFQTFTLSENFGWVKSKHHLHFGGDYRWIHNKYYASTNPRGSFTFTGSSTAEYVNGTAVSGTGYDLADFLLGYTQSASVAYSQVRDKFLGDSYDLFILDDWRWHGNLSLNLGLRYEFIAPFHEAHNQLANLDVGFNGNQFLDAIPVQPNSFGSTQPGFYHGYYGAGLMKPDRRNFAPRIGIAWKPLGNKTVVRAGYGINYNLGQYASIVQSLAAQPPYAVTETNSASATGPSSLCLANGFFVANVSCPVTNSATMNPSTEGTTTNNYAIDPRYRTAYVQMWNLNIQHEITPTLLLNVGYTGSKGSRLDMLRAPNRDASGLVNPAVEAFNWETSQGSSILHAGTVRLRKRMTRGFSAGGTYTYSKSIDNASSIGGTAQVVAQNDQDLRAERGLSSFDQRQKLSADWTYELPWGEGRRWLTRPGFAQKALGDWLVQSTITAASGTPFTARILGSYEDVAGGVNGTLRANYNGESIQIGDRSIKHWFNTAAFSAPPAGTYGTAGRNTIVGPGTWVFNFVLSKNFPIREGNGIEARAEADNVFNHPNYSGIDTTVNSPTYGEVTSVASMRKMTLSLHYRF